MWVDGIGWRWIVMPKRSFKSCAYIHCNALTRETYCDEHSTSMDKEYKQNRQDQKEQRFYSSNAWIRLRNEHRLKDPLCIRCLQHDKLAPVQVIDHIIPLKEDWSQRLSPDNLQSLCNSCHNLKTAEDKIKYNL